MQRALDWLATLPPLALYLALAVTAAVENVFPPVPADSVVAFGSFLAARGEASALGAFLATWLGNVGGAMAMYAVGRRYGADEVRKRLVRYAGEESERRLEQLYARRGLAALFISRFVPGVRALVPPFAGALKVPAASAAAVIATASAVWYGVVTYLAFRVGTDWEAVRARMAAVSRNVGLVAIGVTLLIVGWFFWRSRSRRTR